MVGKPILARLLATASILVAATPSALAQDEFDAYFADIGILQLKPVQTELKVTETQRANMNKHADWLRQQGTAVESQVKAGKLTAEKANTLMAAHLATLKKKVIGELSASQLRRLREITLQRDGLLPLLHDKIASRIGMTKAQLTRLREAYEENDEKVKDIQTKAYKPIFDKYAAMKPKNEAETKTLLEQRDKELEAAKTKIQPQLEALGKSFSALVDTTLTKGQKDEFTALKGKPFTPKTDGK